MIACVSPELCPATSSAGVEGFERFAEAALLVVHVAGRGVVHGDRRGVGDPRLRQRDQSERGDTLSSSRHHPLLGYLLRRQSIGGPGRRAKEASTGDEGSQL